MVDCSARAPSRRSATVLALGASIVHFTAAFFALRTLLSATSRGTGTGVTLHVAVALLTFPLFYTPVPALFGGRPHAGLYIAALNALLWGGAVWALVRWRAGGGRRAAVRRAGV